MPTYEYACRDCGEHLEVVQSFKDDALTVCPACDGRLRKVFSAAPIVFKGSGWHIKDYGTSGSRNDAPASTEGTSSGGDPGGSATGPSSKSDEAQSA